MPSESREPGPRLSQEEIKSELDAMRKASPSYKENVSTARKLIDNFMAAIDRLRIKSHQPQPPDNGKKTS